MSRIAYVNGRYLPHRDARVHVEDRGYQFADAVYEVIAIRDGHFIDEDRHLARLTRSRTELKLAAPMSDAALKTVIHETARRNNVANGIVYLQVSRGVPKPGARSFAFPTGAKPSLVVTARAQTIADPAIAARGVAVITVPDQRWKRPDIKSVSLLPNVIARQAARDADCYEAWQVDSYGNVTEGTSSNAWIVNGTGEVITRHISDNGILSGVTRHGLMDIVARAGLRLTERPFSVNEAKTAREAFLTSATNGVMPVVKIDSRPIGDGRPGALTVTLAAAYRAFMDEIPE